MKKSSTKLLISITCLLMVFSLAFMTNVIASTGIGTKDEETTESITESIMESTQESTEPSENNENKEKRPVWIMSHMCNAKGSAKTAMEKGCNGIEIDVNQYTVKENGVKTQRFYLQHGGCSPKKDAQSLEDLFKDGVLNNENMCLVILDIKNGDQAVDLAWDIHRFTNKYLRDDKTHKKPCFIYSVDGINKTTKFHYVDTYANEGICVDQKNYPKDVLEKVFNRCTTDHCWYGCGWALDKFSWMNKCETCCREAVKMRDEGCKIKKVESWTIQHEGEFKARLLDWGVDALLVSDGIRDKVTTLMNDKDISKTVRLATKDDDPFEGPKKN